MCLRRSRVRSKKYLEKVIRQDLTHRQLTEDMTLDRRIWRSRIRMEDQQVVEHCRDSLSSSSICTLLLPFSSILFHPLFLLLHLSYHLLLIQLVSPLFPILFLHYCIFIFFSYYFGYVLLGSRVYLKQPLCLHKVRLHIHYPPHAPLVGFHLVCCCCRHMPTSYKRFLCNVHQLTLNVRYLLFDQFLEYNQMHELCWS